MKNNTVTVERDSEGRVISVMKYDGDGRLIRSKTVKYFEDYSISTIDMYGVDGEIMRRYLVKRDKDGTMLHERIIRKDDSCGIAVLSDRPTKSLIYVNERGEEIK